MLNKFLKNIFSAGIKPTGSTELDGTELFPIEKRDNAGIVKLTELISYLQTKITSPDDDTAYVTIGTDQTVTGGKTLNIANYGYKNIQLFNADTTQNITNTITLITTNTGIGYTYLVLPEISHTIIATGVSAIYEIKNNTSLVIGIRGSTEDIDNIGSAQNYILKPNSSVKFITDGTKWYSFGSINNYLPLAGGTMTGALNTNSNISLSNSAVVKTDFVSEFTTNAGTIDNYVWLRKGIVVQMPPFIYPFDVSGTIDAQNLLLGYITSNNTGAVALTLDTLAHVMAALPYSYGSSFDLLIDNLSTSTNDVTLVLPTGYSNPASASTQVAPLVINPATIGLFKIIINSNGTGAYVIRIY